MRNPFAWADGQKPVTRTIGYDGYNRATAVNYTYATASGDDLHESPNLAEHTNGLGADKRGKPQPEVAFDTRVRSETYAYDGLGNRTNSGDDQNGFYDRSLGVEAHDAARPYQLTSALIGVGTHQGSLTASYDAAGNQTGLSVLRDAASCMPIGANCNQRYAYEWDEYNRLTRARRWDGANLGTANDPLPETAAAADLVYAYNGADSRTRTTVVHPGVADDVHTLYIYASLELRRTGFDGENNDYLLDATHERVYLGANGERLAQLRPDEAGLPAYTGEARVFFEFADHLGSANTVVDKRTGELVEKRTYTAYGSIESDHRQDRWGQFREDYGFTTKEEDVEVGLTYFGKRFYNPRLGRWLNADPLAVHSPGEADLNLYAYVSGRVFSSVDPLGLQAQAAVAGGAVACPECALVVPAVVAGKVANDKLKERYGTSDTHAAQTLFKAEVTVTVAAGASSLYRMVRPVEAGEADAARRALEYQRNIAREHEAAMRMALVALASTAVQSVSTPDGKSPSSGAKPETPAKDKAKEIQRSEGAPSPDPGDPNNGKKPGSKAKLTPNQTRAVVALVASGLAAKSIRGGAARSAAYSDGWTPASLRTALDRFAPGAAGVRSTDGVKTFYQSAGSSVRVAADNEGGYFRIEDTSIAGKRRFLNMSGANPSNRINENGSQSGRTQGEYNQATHFKNTD